MTHWNSHRLVLPLAFAALASLFAAAAAASAGPSAMRILHVTLDPGNYIDAATTISAEDKKKIFEGNARRVFSRLRA